MKFVKTTTEEIEYGPDNLPQEVYAELVTHVLDGLEMWFCTDGYVSFAHEFNNNQFSKMVPLSELVNGALSDFGKEELPGVLAEIEKAAELVRAAMTPNAELKGRSGEAA